MNLKKKIHRERRIRERDALNRGEVWDAEAFAHMDIADFEFSKLFELVRNDHTDGLDVDEQTEYVSESDSDAQYTPSEDYLYDETDERIREDLEEPMSEAQVMDDMRKLLRQ